MTEALDLIGHPTSERVFVLGAGFSHHLSGGRLPLLGQLAEDLSASLPWLATYGKHPSDSNIERILTNLELDIAETNDEAALAELRSRRAELVREITRRIEDGAVSGEALDAARGLCTRLFSAGDYILTFNWDCLLEKLLFDQGFWKPYDGYGWSMSIPQSGEGGREFNPFFITILKLHGSLNFNRSSYGGEHLEVTDRWNDTRVIEDEEAAHVPLLTMPTYVKYFAEERGFVYIWREAMEAVARARVLVVLGYSFPRADALARLLFSFAGTASPLSRVAIVNWSPADCRHIQEQLRDVATLAAAPVTNEETVDWQLLPAEVSGAYDDLLAVLNDWPTGDLRLLMHAVEERATFPGRLELLRRLNARGRP